MEDVRLVKLGNVKTGMYPYSCTSAQTNDHLAQTYPGNSLTHTMYYYWKMHFGVVEKSGSQFFRLKSFASWVGDIVVGLSTDTYEENDDSTPAPEMAKLIPKPTPYQMSPYSEVYQYRDCTANFSLCKYDIALVDFNHPKGPLVCLSQMENLYRRITQFT